ncbi:hypothetical protein NKG94_15325 [Micromonospora sp. M12]
MFTRARRATLPLPRSTWSNCSEVLTLVADATRLPAPAFVALT